MFKARKDITWAVYFTLLYFTYLFLRLRLTSSSFEKTTTKKQTRADIIYRTLPYGYLPYITFYDFFD